MKKQITALSVIMIFAGFTSTASALSLGTNITIADGEMGYTWGSDNGPYGEDNEVEPRMQRHQKWDLEGFFLQGKTLSMVGGFNFRDGVSAYDNNPDTELDFRSGDIFLDIDGDYTSANAAPQGGQVNINYNFNYDFVIDLAFFDGLNTGSYIVRDIRADDIVTQRVQYPQNQDGAPSSDPWKWVSGGIELSEFGGDFQFYSGLSDSEAGGFLGDNHYAVTGIDLSFLSLYGGYTDFVSHFTMGCGNDNLMGQGAAHAPEPATMLLFGTGLTGLAAFARKREKV